MALYDKASLVLIPSGTKEGVLFSQKPTNGDGDFTFSRSTAATRVNADGLIEKETQNLLLQSNSFDTTWGVGGTLVGGQTDKDGGSSAWSFTSNTGTSGLNQGITTGGVQTFSAYIKKNATNGVRIYMFGSINASPWFNLDTGSVVSLSNAVDATIVEYNSEWWRISVTCNSTLSSVYLYCTNNNLTQVVGTITIQDAQLEYGLVARDYIETTTAAVEGGITDNIPRLDYTDASCPALLLEPQRTNLVTQSEYLDAVFVPTNITQTTNYGTSPDGNLTSTRIQLDNLTDSRTVETFTGIVTSGVTYTFSCYYKGINGETTYMYFLDGNGITSVSKKITFNGEWQRESITFEAGTASNYTYIVDARQGTSTATDFEVWGAQLEEGAYATSYIPTYGTSVTRNRDYFNPQILGLTSYEQGVFFVDFDRGVDSASVRDASTDGIAYRYTGTFGSGAAIEIATDVDGDVRVALRSGIFTQLYSDNTLSRYKIAVKWSGTSLKVFVNGVLEYNNSTKWNVTNDFRYIGYNADFRKSVNQLLTFPTALSDDECIALTQA